MTNQTIEQAVEEIEECWGDYFDGYLCCDGHDCNCSGKETAVEFRRHITQALQAQRDAGAREEKENIIEIVKFTKFRDTQTQEPYHKYLQQSKGVEYIRNKILKALTPPTK